MQLTLKLRPEWLLSVVRYYQSLGFFDDYHSLEDEELATLLEARWAEMYGDLFKPTDIFEEMLVVRWDESRVWWKDLEADVLNGNEVYLETLKQWGDISRGAFNPQSITEMWSTEEGPITVKFVANTQHYTLQPEFMFDWLDIGILRSINRTLRSSGYQFEMYNTNDQTALVVALTTNEKKKLESERGWQFLNLATTA